MDLFLNDQLNFPAVLDLFQSNMIKAEQNLQIENKTREYLDYFLDECTHNLSIPCTNAQFLGSIGNSNGFNEISNLFDSFDYKLSNTFSNLISNYNLNLELTDDACKCYLKTIIKIIETKTFYSKLTQLYQNFRERTENFLNKILFHGYKNLSPVGDILSDKMNEILSDTDLNTFSSLMVASDTEDNLPVDIHQGNRNNKGPEFGLMKKPSHNYSTNGNTLSRRMSFRVPSDVDEGEYEIITTPKFEGNREVTENTEEVLSLESDVKDFTKTASEFKRKSIKFLTKTPEDKIKRLSHSYRRSSKSSSDLIQVSIEDSNPQKKLLAIASQMYKSNLITSIERGLLKELILDHDKTLLELVEDLENNRESIDEVYRKIKSYLSYL